MDQAPLPELTAAIFADLAGGEPVVVVVRSIRLHATWVSALAAVGARRIDGKNTTAALARNLILIDNDSIGVFRRGVALARVAISGATPCDEATLGDLRDAIAQAAAMPAAELDRLAAPWQGDLPTAADLPAALAGDYAKADDAGCRIVIDADGRYHEIELRPREDGCDHFERHGRWTRRDAGRIDVHVTLMARESITGDERETSQHPANERGGWDLRGEGGRITALRRKPGTVPSAIAGDVLLFRRID